MQLALGGMLIAMAVAGLAAWARVHIKERPRQTLRGIVRRREAQRPVVPMGEEAHNDWMTWT